MKFKRKQSSTDLMTRDALAALGAMDKVRAIIWFDLDGTILDANENFQKAMGYELNEIVGQNHKMFVYPRFAKTETYREMWAQLARGEPVTGQFPRLRKDQSKIWIEAAYSPVFDEHGKPVKVVKFAIDITERKMAAMDAAGQLEAISRSQAVIEFDLDGTIRTANENFLGAVGYSLSEIQGKHHRMFVDPAEASGSDYKAFWDNLGQGEFKSGEFRRIGKGGREIWIQASYNPIIGPDGKAFKVVKFASDITESKNKAADYRGQIKAIGKSQAVIEFTLEGTILSANENFLTTTGYSLAEIEGKHHRMFCEPELARSGEYSDFWQALARGEFQSGEYKRIGKGGKIIWIQASYNPILNPNGKPYKVVKYASDITERKVAVEAMAEGLTALSEGNLTARIPDSVGGDFAVLRQTFNTTIVRLEKLVEGILDAALTIADDTNGIAHSAEDLSTRNEQQAAKLEETTSAMEKISSMLKSTADNAETAREAASAASKHAEDGGGIVQDAVAAMKRIEESSSEIGKIIQVIESIAFQTNLLALNAGVEAARAGEAGKGFAVVATEVRALAQRASEASQEINTLIATSGKEVATGAKLVNQSGTALSDIVAAVNSVVENITGISSASSDQAAGVSEVTNAVSEIDRTIQHTAAIAEESSAGAAQLADRAANLRELVRFFRTGTAASEDHKGASTASDGYGEKTGTGGWY